MQLRPASRTTTLSAHPIPQMLSRDDQASVTLALETRLADYFDGGDGGFWGDDGGGGDNDDDEDGDGDWLMADGNDGVEMGLGRGASFEWDGAGGGGGGNGSGSGCSFRVDASAAAAWLAGGGVNAVCSGLLAES